MQVRVPRSSAECEGEGEGAESAVSDNVDGGDCAHTNAGDKSYTNGSYANDSHTNDSYANDSHTNDSYANDSHTNDSYANDSHTNDSYANDSHTNDSYENESYENDSYEKDSYENNSYANAGTKTGLVLAVGGGWWAAATERIWAQNKTVFLRIRREVGDLS
ncbi:probable ATP-dependent RNA helicase ddx42 [Penaeus indicus]|uniref:probable ATP-dependent RNA helicase ddx42 n=1 Tax=Penaeus indicus TaxID=29960 RepID=UPI00300C42F5